MVKQTYQKHSTAQEWGNIISHGLGIPFALVALILLLSEAMQRDTAYTVVVLVYGLSMLWTYLTSTLYHSSYKASIKWRNRWHLLDHTAIYLFIAGSYTPIAYYMLPSVWSTVILISVWVIAVAGVVLKFFMLGRFKKLSLALYLIMGWLIVAAAKPLWLTAPPELVYWIAAGGASYSIGTVFFSLRQMPYSHTVWHVFVLGGTVCHFWGIYKYI